MNSLGETLRKQLGDGQELIDIMLGIARGGERDADKIQAVKWLSEHTYGKPTEHHELTGPNGGPIEIDAKIDFSAIPAPELSEYESVLAKLNSRMAAPVGSPPGGEMPPQAN